MKKSILLFILVLVSSCDVHYEGEDRFVVDLKTIDRNGNPLSNQYVAITSEIPSFSYPDLISYGRTNNQGNLTLIFPSRESAKYEIKIGNSNEYTNKKFTNLLPSNFENHKLTLEPILFLKPDDITTLSLEIFDTSSAPTDLINIKIEGLVSSDYFNFNPQPTTQYIPERSFDIAKNQSFVLKYIVKDLSTNIKTTYSVNLTVANEPINYTINY